METDADLALRQAQFHVRTALILVNEVCYGRLSEDSEYSIETKVKLRATHAQLAEARDTLDPFG